MGTQDSAVGSPSGVPAAIDLADGQPHTSGALAPKAPQGVASTRASRAWVKVFPALVVLAVILLFVFQNSQSAKVSFVTASGRLPLALALLAAAALGGLFVLALGSVRILQLRRVIHRSHGAEAGQREAGQP